MESYNVRTQSLAMCYLELSYDEESLRQAKNTSQMNLIIIDNERLEQHRSCELLLYMNRSAVAL